MNDRDVIDAFVAHLREDGNPGLHVERRPDEENRSSSEVIYREEVTQLEEVDPEIGFYDVPESFKKIAYERSCIELP